MQGKTVGFAALSDAITPVARSADGRISAKLMQSKTGGFAALTTDLSITTHMDVLVPCPELSQTLSEEMPLGCEAHGCARAADVQDAQVPCPELSQTLNEEMPLGCGGQGWPRAARATAPL